MLITSRPSWFVSETEVTPKMYILIVVNGFVQQALLVSVSRVRRAVLAALRRRRWLRLAVILRSEIMHMC